MDTLVQSLKLHNCKITPQRMAVYQVVRASGEHLNAEAIYKQLVTTYPTMSLATVYKSLELFSELGLIQTINIGENSFRYEANTSSHSHVVCTVCNKVEDLDDTIFSHAIGSVEKESNYKISKQHLCFYGVCPNCLK